MLAIIGILHIIIVLEDTSHQMGHIIMILDNEHHRFTLATTLFQHIGSLISTSALHKLDRGIHDTVKTFFHVLLLLARQFNGKHGTLILHAVHSYRAPHRHHHVTHHRQADAHTLDQSFGLGRTVKRFKHMEQIFLSDAHTVIGYPDDKHAPVNTRGHRNLTELAAIVQGIVHKTAHNSTQVTGHCVNLDTILKRGIDELDMAFHTLLTVFLQCHAHECHHVASVPLEIINPASHATHLQNAVHKK